MSTKQKSQSQLKAEQSLKIRNFIRANPKMISSDVAEEFGVSVGVIGANRAHITMRTDTDNPQERKAPKRGKKAIKKDDLYYGVRKLDARNRQVKAILKSKKLDGNVLTLSGAGLIVENDLYIKGAKNLSYDIVERDRTTFNQILLALSSSPLKVTSISNITMSQKIFESHTDKYAHAQLDYVDTINSNKSDIDTALENNIVQKGGLVCMTFCMRSQPIMSVPKVENEAINLTAAKKYLERFENYKLVESFTYQDTTPMMLLIVKRTK